VKVGDLATLRSKMYDSRAGEVCLIIDIVAHNETYTSTGCKKYIVLRATGSKYQCLKGDLDSVEETQ